VPDPAPVRPIRTQLLHNKLKPGSATFKVAEPGKFFSSTLFFYKVFE